MVDLRLACFQLFGSEEARGGPASRMTPCKVPRRTYLPFGPFRPKTTPRSDPRFRNCREKGFARAVAFLPCAHTYSLHLLRGRERVREREMKKKTQ